MLMRKKLIVLTISLAVLACSSAVPKAAFWPTPAPLTVVVPQTILLHGERVAEAKRALLAGDEELTASLVSILDSALAAYNAEPLSVMQKKRMPPSGNKHDYMSMAPYWWPDTTKPNGLPFIRRDGEMYPESRTDHDGLRLQATIERVRSLSLAWYLTEDARYAQAAAK